MKSSVTPPAVSAKPAVVAVQPSSCCMNCGWSTVLAFNTPPTSIMRKQQMAKFLKRNTLRLMSGFFCRHSHATRPTMPAMNRNAKKADKAGREPVVLLALVEHDLHSAHGDGEKAQANVVHVAQLRGVGLDPGRIFNHARNQKKRQNAYRNMMKKIQRQEKLSVIQPPSVGPMEGASTATRP